MQQKLTGTKKELCLNKTVGHCTYFNSINYTHRPNKIETAQTLTKFPASGDILFVTKN